MVKKNGEWYVHFVLKKEVELPDEPETIIAIDRVRRILQLPLLYPKTTQISR